MLGLPRRVETPHAVIHRQHETALRYFPTAVPQTAAPLFLNASLINTWPVFDLLPGRSLIGALTGAGVPVYVMDWGRPGPEASERPLSQLIDSTLPRALRRAARHARANGLLAADQRLDALGYSVGGTFLAMALSRHPELAARVVLLCAPIDFHASGRFAKLADPSWLPLDDLVDGSGNIPANLMRLSFLMVDPAANVRRLRQLWSAVGDVRAVSDWWVVQQWLLDSVAFPGECYREYVQRCYIDNALVSGGWELGGRPVSLADGRIPALVVAGGSDTICAPAGALALAHCWGGPVTTELLDAGHIDICLGSALPALLLEWLRA